MALGPVFFMCTTGLVWGCFRFRPRPGSATGAQGRAGLQGVPRRQCYRGVVERLATGPSPDRSDAPAPVEESGAAAPSATRSPLRVRWLGRIAYRDAWDLQHRLVRARASGPGPRPADPPGARPGAHPRQTRRRGARPRHPEGAPPARDRGDPRRAGRRGHVPRPGPAGRVSHRAARRPRHPPQAVRPGARGRDDPRLCDRGRRCGPARGPPGLLVRGRDAGAAEDRRARGARGAGSHVPRHRAQRGRGPARLRADRRVRDAARDLDLDRRGAGSDRRAADDRGRGQGGGVVRARAGGRAGHDARRRPAAGRRHGVGARGVGGRPGVGGGCAGGGCAGEAAPRPTSGHARRRRPSPGATAR